MYIFFDENFPHQLAEGFNKLQAPLNKRNKTNYIITSIKTFYGEGVKDEEWIPKAGAAKAVVITRDLRIQTTRHQKELCKQYELGLFFLSSSKAGLPYWEIVKLLIDKWETILNYIEKENKPFAYRFTSKGSKFEKIG